MSLNNGTKLCNKQNCEVYFTPKRRNHKYCSRKCLINSYIENNYYKNYADNRFDRFNRFKSFDLLFNEILKDINYIYFKIKLKQECLEKFIDVRNQINTGSKFRNPNKLGPTFIFMFFMSKGINIKNEVIKHYGLTRTEFRRTLKRIIPLYKDYLKRDKKKIIFSQIEMIIYNLRLSSEFVQTSLKIFDAFWSYLKNTKEESIVGAIILLSVMKMNIKHDVFYNACELIGVSPSSIYNVIDNHIFSKVNLEGYTTFKIASEIVKKFVNKKLQLLV